MNNVFTRQDNEIPKEYLNKMFEKTLPSGELSIARFEDDYCCITASSFEDASYVERHRMTWTKEDADKLYVEYLDLIDEIYSADDKTFESLFTECSEYLKSRAKRLRKLIELHAPEIIIENEKVAFIEALAINAFAVTSKTIEKDDYLRGY